LRPQAASRYRIRKEPRPECLSTIESIVRALQLCERRRPAGLDELLAAFDTMVDRQIVFLESRSKEPRRRQRPKSECRIPRAFTASAERLVVVYAESALGETMERSDPRELVQLVAVRVPSRALFEAIVRPRGAWTRPWHLAHMGLTDQDLAGGVTGESLQREWSDFLEPDDTLVAWNQGIIRLLEKSSASTEKYILLKSAYGSFRPGTRGSLDDVVAREGLARPELALRGRARERLGNALALTELLCGARGTSTTTRDDRGDSAADCRIIGARPAHM
jgi:hypothetical protein